MSAAGEWPGIVKSVDRARREVRVEVPGVTDGADILPLAEIRQAIGDRSEQTEIRILPGDLVWVAFMRGDPRYPIITGFRAKHTGNDVGTRRWVHDNFESIADAIYRVQAGEKVVLDVGGTLVTITAGKVQVDAGQMEFNGDSTFNGNVAINGNTTASGTVAAQGTVSSAASVSAPAATIGGINFGSHRHTGVDTGSGTSGGPV